ncbi:CoA protein activase, partial [candidate division WOR-3 bacterium]|nr:CoA protein activase [candidate division WOR-3 bacterium]
MRAAFPYMGDIRLVLQPMLETLGCEVVTPPDPTAETLARGARLAPELMCLPFKVTLGNMLWCAERGADTLVYVSGAWSCRFGYYGRLQADILRSLGFRFEVIELRHDELPRLARRVVSLSDGRPGRAVVRSLRAVRLGWAKS